MYHLVVKDIKGLILLGTDACLYIYDLVVYDSKGLILSDRCMFVHIPFGSIGH